MTTTIIIEALCAPTKEVVVDSDTGHGRTAGTLQDGESLTLHVHEPEHFVKVQEVDKQKN